MMHVEQNSKLPLLEYDLIDYSAQLVPSPRPPLSTVKMTELEAYHINQGFAMNNVSKRYIRKDQNEQTN